MQPLDPKGVYTDAQVIAALSGANGTRTMRYRYDRLDSLNTFIESITQVVVGAKVSNNALADIKRTASFTVLDRTAINWLRDRVRPWAVLAMPNGGTVEWPLGTFLLSTPERVVSEAGVVMREVKAYDQLLVLQQDKVTDRLAVAAGTAYTTAIASVVSGVGGIVANIVPSALTLPVALEWEPGTTKLRVLNDLLDALNYESAWFDEYGTLICRPYQSPTVRPSTYTYSDQAASVRTGEATQGLDLFEIPNKWVATVSEADRVVLSSTYTNVSPTSPTSTVNRGRTIVEVLTEQDAADQATLDAKVARAAFEASQIYESVKFDTVVMPMHSNADVVTLNVPDLGVSAKYSEQSWEMELQTGGRMSHQVRRVVSV